MLTRMLVIILVSAVIGSASPAAAAASICGPRDKIVTALGEKYQENRRSLGISGFSAVIELFVSTKGSWTLVATNTKGVSCLIAAGQDWQDAPLPLGGLSS
jgi:hypothetical protein